MKRYCTYITHYTGNKLPKWYIGSSTEERIKNGYNGSVVSVKWKDLYRSEQKENKHLFKTRILSYYDTVQESQAEELRLQKMHNVVKNNNYFNEAYASVNGCFGRDVSGKLNPMYNLGRTLSETHKKNIGNSVSGEKNGMYGKTHTDEVRRKLSVINSRPLEERLSKENADKVRRAVSEAQLGKPKSEEHKKKLSEASKKRWANTPIVTCPYCGKEGKGSAMNRWHFDNCKHKKE